MLSEFLGQCQSFWDIVRIFVTLTEFPWHINSDNVTKILTTSWKFWQCHKNSDNFTKTLDVVTKTLTCHKNSDTVTNSLTSEIRGLRLSIHSESFQVCSSMFNRQLVMEKPKPSLVVCPFLQLYIVGSKMAKGTSFYVLRLTVTLIIITLW